MNNFYEIYEKFRSLSEAPEDQMPASPDEENMATGQLSYIATAADELRDYVDQGGDFPEWMQNKIAAIYDKIQGLHAYAIGDEGRADEPDLDLE
jgi:hypothetical protein